MFFILKIFPDWFWWLLLIAGLSGYFLSNLILQKPYALICKILSSATICLVIFVFGFEHSSSTWTARVQELEARVAQAEQQSTQVNERIVTRVITKTKLVKDTLSANQETLQNTVAAQVDASCTLPVSSIVLHNSASQAQVAAGPASTDGTPSGVTASTLLGTVVDNYSSCYQNAIKLQAWQDWYREQKAIYESLP